MCFILWLHSTSFISLSTANCLNFVVQKDSVLYDVWSDFLNTVKKNFRLKSTTNNLNAQDLNEFVPLRIDMLDMVMRDTGP